MRRVNTKGASQADDMWSGIYAHRDSMRVNANIKPKKVTLVKANGDTVDVTQAYLESY